jgi:hypothetical protein
LPLPRLLQCLPLVVALLPNLHRSHQY